MSRQPGRLKDGERAKLWELWKQKQGIAWIAEQSGHTRETVRRYRRLDGWDERLQKIRVETERRSDKTEVDERSRLTNMIRAAVSATFKRLYDIDGRKLAKGTTATLGDLDRLVQLLLKLKGEPDSVIEIRVGVAIAQQTEIFVEAANRIPDPYRQILRDAVLAGARRFTGEQGDTDVLEP